MHEFEFFELGLLKKLRHQLCDNPMNFPHFVTVSVVMTIACLC